MNEDLTRVARERFGFSSFLPGQERVLSHLLEGKSAAAIFPTGGGKSLCYQLPSQVLPGVTLVVSPLIALMKDQIDALSRRGVRAHRLDSTLGAAEARAVMDEVRSGECRLLYVAPERFQNERFRESLKGLRISLFAVDEAHCISEWGHNFRPDYLKLARIAKASGAERVLALTATAPPRVADDICAAFEIEPSCLVRTPFHRPNLDIRLTPVRAEERDAALLTRLRERPSGPTLVYVTLQKTAEDVAQRLSAAGLDARAYHAGLPDEERAAVQDRFLSSRAGIVVATVAFGMGVDKPDIRYVYHYNPPKSLESYAQEIGRAGRDGEPSICEALLCPDDTTAIENFAFGDTPSDAAVRGFVGELFSFGERFDVDHNTLSREHDIRISVVRTLLTYLELDGWLEGGTPFYSRYKFRPLRSSAEILAKVDAERGRFLRGIFASAEKKTRRDAAWLHIDAMVAAERTGSPRERVVRALDWLSQEGHIELRAEGVRHRYRRLRAPDDEGALAAELAARMRRREEGELARLSQVFELARLEGCQSRALAAHFGDADGDPCGHCSFCVEGPTELPPRKTRPVDVDKIAAARALAEEHALLREPRALARFLCGLASPRLTAEKLGRHALFGALSDVPFAEVLRAAEGTREDAPVS